jgi:hypothetical protein
MESATAERVEPTLGTFGALSFGDSDPVEVFLGPFEPCCCGAPYAGDVAMDTSVSFEAGDTWRIRARILLGRSLVCVEPTPAAIDPPAVGICSTY